MIGVPDEEAGELPKAFVVPAGDELDADELMAFVAEQVAPHKQIRLVEFVDEIPKSPSGKILRRVLEGARAGRLELVALSAAGAGARPAGARGLRGARAGIRRPPPCRTPRSSPSTVCSAQARCQ